MWRDSKNRVWLSLVAGMAAGFLISSLCSCKKGPVKIEENNRPVKKSAPPAAGVKQPEEEKFLYASHEKRDPMVPLVDKKGRPVAVVEGGIQFKISDLSLEGIIWDEAKPLAIINDEVVSCGDKVSGVSVVKIEKDKVILNYQNETFELKME